jgi:hypothetical protein
MRILMNYSIPDFNIESITPQMAAKYLATSPGNRNLRKNHILILAALMRKGLFYLGNDCILFDKQGRLRNGHHRLNAAILAQVAIDCMVRRNVPEEELVSIDTGQKRSFTDAAEFNSKLIKMSNREVAILKALKTAGWKFRTADLQDYPALGEDAIKYSPNIEFVVNECFQGKDVKKITTSPVLAVFARAHYNGYSADKLKYAANILLYGAAAGIANPLPGTKSINVLRDWLVSNGSSSNQNRIDTYNTAQNLIKCFLDGEDRTKASKSKLDLFPIPESEKTAIRYVSPMFLAAIDKASADFSDNQVLSPTELGEQLVKVGGFKSTGANHVKSAATRFAKLVKAESFIATTNGFVKPYVTKGNKITSYIFVKDNKKPSVHPIVSATDSLLSQLRG